MNFSRSQWWTAFVLDVLVKAVFGCVALGVHITQGLESPNLLAPFILVAALFSGFHFLCLFFGNRLVGSLPTTSRQRSGVLKFVLVLIFGNVLFILGVSAFQPVFDDIFDGVVLSAFIAAANLASILLVAAAGGLLHLVKRRA